jgi:hypothetical protein
MQASRPLETDLTRVVHCTQARIFGTGSRLDDYYEYFDSLKGDFMTVVFMTVVIVLLALSAGIGLALGASFNWYEIPISSLPLALLSAAVLQMAGFGALSGIALVVACLTLSQIACVVMGVTLAYTRSEGEPHEKAA